MKKIYLIIAAILTLSVSSCKKEYLETNPSDAITEEQIYKELASIYAALDGTTNQLFAFGTNGSGRHDNYGQKSIDLQLDLMGNDMVVNSQGYGWYNRIYQYIEWTDNRSGRPCDNAWFYYYDIIRQVNKILSVVDKVADATPAEKEKIKGECLGFRAYGYYYLINLLQQTYVGNEDKPGVPLYVEAVTEGKGRGTARQVYEQLVADLELAETYLTGKTRSDKTEINVDVVRGFRARVALLMGEWAKAEQYARLAYTGYPLMQGASYNAIDAFSSIANPECMWGSLIPETQATIYASFYSHMDVNTGGYAALGQQKKITQSLYDEIAPNDVRKSCWTAPGTGSDPNVDLNQVKLQVPNPGSWAADYLYMRASEMYLIEAEAMARQGNDAGARTTLEKLLKNTNRCPTYSASGLSGQALIEEILTQRKIELWGEGFGLIDVKRSGLGLNRPSGPGNHGGSNFNPVVYTTGPNDPRFLMRIPQREFETNANLTIQDQNP